MFYSIDRLEESLAVLISNEDGSIVYVSREELPCSAKEGNILTFKDGKYIFDPEETARRRKSLFLRTRRLGKK